LSQDYDKIIKENLESLILPLARKVLNLPEPAGLVEIPDDIQQTVERKPDFLKLVTDENGVGEYVLHLEFQTRNEADMLSRMLFYAALLYGKYKLPIRQYVFFIGNGRARMNRELIQDDLTFQYHIRNIADVDYTVFLDTQQPEEVILAILGNLGSEPIESVIGQILQRLRATAHDTQALGRFYKQLEVLSKLRDAQEEVLNQLEAMPIYYDLETDIRYLQGKQKGIDEMIDRLPRAILETRQETKGEDVRGLLQLGILSVEQIATALNVPIDFVLMIKAQLPGTPNA
jgi:hypothetical protein